MGYWSVKVLSDSDQNVRVTLEEKREKGRLARSREWLGMKIAGKDATERMQDTWGRIHRIGGFLPIFVEGRLELRTQKQEDTLKEIREEMEKCKTSEELRQAMFKSNVKVFNLFHTTGSQWMRGLQDSVFAGKIRAYLEFYQRVFDSPSFATDLFTASMAMLNYSWKPEDVGSVPPYLIETKTVVQPEKQGRVDMGNVKEY